MALRIKMIRFRNLETSYIMSYPEWGTEQYSVIKHINIFEAKHMTLYQVK